MSYSRQKGHALAVTMIIVILFALLSLTALRNGLIDRKIAHAFASHQTNEERYLSALRYFETVILSDLFHPESELFRSFQSIEVDSALELVLPINSILSGDLTTTPGEVRNPVVRIFKIENTDSSSLSPAESILLRSQIINPTFEHQIIANYEIPIDPSSGTVNVVAMKRLSVRKM